MKTLRSIFVAAFIVLLIKSTQAQTIIPKVGISLGSVKYSDDIVDSDTDMKSKIGLVLGAGLQFKINEKFSLQPEFLFHQKAFKAEYEDIEYSEEGSISLNYLELPVLAKLNFGNFYINAGPSFGFGIGGKYEYKLTDKIDPSYSESYSGKIKFGKESENYMGDDSYIDNALDVSFQFGAGYIIAGKILLDVRYGLGMTNLFDKDVDYDINDNTSKTRTLQFTVGIPIEIGSK